MTVEIVILGIVLSALSTSAICICGIRGNLGAGFKTFLSKTKSNDDLNPPPLTTRENETPLKGDYVYISSEEYKDSIGELLQCTGKNRWRVRLLEYQNQVAEIDGKFLKKIDMRNMVHWFPGDMVQVYPSEDEGWQHAEVVDFRKGNLVVKYLQGEMEIHPNSPLLRTEVRAVKKSPDTSPYDTKTAADSPIKEAGGVLLETYYKSDSEDESLHVGDHIEILNDFQADDEHGRMLKKGMKLFIKSIDDENDIVVNDVGPTPRKDDSWILNDNLCNIKRINRPVLLGSYVSEIHDCPAGEIRGSSIVWPSGAESEFEFIDSRKIKLEFEGELLQASVQDPTQIVWSDGDIWRKRTKRIKFEMDNESEDDSDFEESNIHAYNKRSPDAIAKDMAFGGDLEMIDIKRDPAATKSLENEMQVCVEFLPGLLGFSADWELGSVSQIQPNSQANEKDVKPGWRMIEIDEKPYSEQILDAKISGKEPFLVTFQKPIEK